LRNNVEIDTSAKVHPEAKLAEGVKVGAFTVVGPHVEIGEDTRIGNNCTVTGRTKIGRDNQIFSSVVLGSHPQDITYKQEPTRLIIGDNNCFREFVSINVGTDKGGGVTQIGSNCMFMACSHVAHDSSVGDGVIMINNALVAGHVSVEDNAVLNGAAAVNQFVTIGKWSYVGGLTRIVQDVPPFTIMEGHPARIRGINVIGLHRGGFTEEKIDALKAAHKFIFRSSRIQSRALKELEGHNNLTEEVRYLVEFLRRREKGKSGRWRETQRLKKNA